MALKDVRQGREQRGKRRPDGGFKVQPQSTGAAEMVLPCGFAVVGLCILIALLGAASVLVQEGNISPAPAAERSWAVDPAMASMMPPRQCICTMEYDPVCGRTTDGNLSNFGNPCRARCARATVLARGRC